MKYIILILTVIMLSCSTRHKSGSLQFLEGEYFFINRKNNFYDELTLRFNRDSTFFFSHRVGPETFEVRGTIKYIKKDQVELTIVDTTSWLRKVPIYEFYHVKDTAIILSSKRIKLNDKKFRRVR